MVCLRTLRIPEVGRQSDYKRMFSCLCHVSCVSALRGMIYPEAL